MTLTMTGLADELRRLRFEKNFLPSFTWEGDISSSATEIISHPLGVVPGGWQLLRVKGSSDIIEGSVWTREQVSLTNSGGSTATLKVVFYAD